MAEDTDLFDILEDEPAEDSESEGFAVIKHNAGIIPPLPAETRLTITELPPTASLTEVRASDLQIVNVQVLSLLHGLQNVRTVDGLCKVNEQISKTLRYKRDILGLEKEKEAKVPGMHFPLIPIE